MATLAYSARSRAPMSALSARLRAVMSRAIARCETVLARNVAHGKLDPGKPACSVCCVDRHVGRTQALAVGEGGVGDKAHLDAQFSQPSADQFSLRPTDKFGENPVGVDDPAVSVAVDDKVAERVDEAEKLLLPFMKLPHPVGHALDAGGGRGRVNRLAGGWCRPRG